VNALIFSLCHFGEDIKLMGSLFDAIEYFLIIQQFNKDFKILLSPFYVGAYKQEFKRNSNLSLNDHLLSEVFKIINARYIIDDPSCFDNIEIIDLNKLILTHDFNKVLLLDMATPKKLKKSFIRAKEVHIITELTTEEYFYTSKHNKVVYHTEMPFCYSDIPYTIKFAFDLYKPINKFKESLYVNYPKKDPLKEEQIKELVLSFNKPLFSKNYQENFYNLHELFNEYVYIKSDAWFDTHPRLFHECKFYGKPFYYHNFLNVKDGSYYRYYAAKEESWKDRNLDKNDTIVKIMSE